MMKIEITYFERPDINVQKVITFTGHAHRATENAMRFIIVHAPLTVTNIRIEPVETRYEAR